MNHAPRILMAAAAVLLAVMYFLPIWQISLEAPQYPEGLGMNIHLNTVRGEKPNDLASINGLNHYIGMKRIEPGSIAELRYMPFIVGAMILFALAAAFRGKRALFLAWTLCMALLGVAGMVDFYMWEYNYGHELDPRAIIKIPGMSYQPPLFGSQQILNFTAYSYPGFGGIAAGLAVLSGAAAWYIAGRMKKKGATTQ